MPTDFSKNTIKSYTYWEIYVNGNQSYLGRCIVWCKRTDALDLADATPGEQAELFSVLHDLRESAKKIFQPDWFNYSFLGNATRHLHCHFIPRYSASKEFNGITFEDKLYGDNYKTDQNFNPPAELLTEVRDEYRKEL